MLNNARNTYWDSCGYARRLEPPTVAGALAPSMTRQTNKWLVGACKWLGAAEGHVDGRILNGLREIIPCVPLFLIDGYVMKDGRQFSCFTEGQMLGELGWGEDAAPRLRRGLRVLALAPAAADGKQIARVCARLREDCKLGPIISPIEKGVRCVHGTVWKLVGIEPLPEPSAIAVDEAANLGGDNSDLGGDNYSTADSVYRPSKQGRHLASGGVFPVPANAAISDLPADSSTIPENGAASQNAVSGAMAANRDIAPSYITSHCSVVSCQGAPKGDTPNSNGKTIKEGECFDALVSLFPRGVGKPEYAPKARSAFDALVAEGAAPEAVLERAKEIHGQGRLPAFPLLLLERREDFADLFRADPQDVMDWAADIGPTSDAPAAHEIFAIRHPDAVGLADLSEEADARIRDIYARNEGDLQRAYALYALATTISAA